MLFAKNEDYLERKDTENKEEYEGDKRGEKSNWKVYITNYTEGRESPKCTPQSLSYFLNLQYSLFQPYKMFIILF